jgi:hypothetical protein
MVCPCPAPPLLRTATLGRLALLLLAAGLLRPAHAPLPLPSGVGHTCKLEHLDARVAKLNKVCCLAKGKAGSRCGKGLSWYKCSVDCAVVLLPLLKDCRPVLDLLYDHLDKNRDGHAGIFTQAYHSCLAIPVPTALDDLTRLHKKHPGVCTDAVLNNVAKTKVVHVCKDKNPKCAAGISSGFVTCPAGGQCDKTCKLCKGGGHRRTEAIAEGGGERRRTQSALTCNLQSFDADMKQLDTKCCDDGGKCNTGIPKVCDAKCAVAFVEFYDRCQKIMAVRFSTKQMEGFTRLHNTCSTRLPTEALLEAVAKCRGGQAWSSASGASAKPGQAPSGKAMKGLTHTGRAGWATITSTSTACKGTNTPSFSTPPKVCYAQTSAEFSVMGWPKSLSVPKGATLTVTGPAKYGRGLDLLSLAMSSQGTVVFNGPTELHDKKTGAHTPRSIDETASPN